MKLFDLGTIPWKQSQLIYHALGNCGEEAVVFCTPQEKYACVGFHQSPPYELDLEFCKDNHIGYFRREIGGGTVLLDNNQIFYQVIVDRAKAPMDQRVLFKKYLTPIINTYRDIGINAEYYPVSDLVVNSKKISGNGGGDIGTCKVMTGSILLDFDHTLMCKILNLPSKEFREDVCKAMSMNLTTVKKELGYIPKLEEIKSVMIANFEELFGTLQISKTDASVQDMMKSIDLKFSDDKWLHKKMKQPDYRSIKIIEGYYFIHLNHSNYEICIVTKDEKIEIVKIYGIIDNKLEVQLNDGLIKKKFDEQIIFDIIDNWH